MQYLRSLASFCETCAYAKNGIGYINKDGSYTGAVKEFTGAFGYIRCPRSWKEFDVEIQRADAGAGAKRARYNSSLLDAHILKPGDDTDDIPDSYVIFITENDVMKGNQSIYPVERYVTVGENKVLFDDGSHIIYVNGQYRGNDEIGRLMHDFSCTDPDDMNYEALAKKARYYK